MDINPEINWKGKHVKISLAGLVGAIVAIAVDPAAAAMIFPAAWVPIIPKVLAIAASSGILYNMDPNKSDPPAPKP